MYVNRGAAEPEILFPGRGVVGIGDAVLVTGGGPECLTITRREPVVACAAAGCL
jgi:Xaa-Pro aminopeptidase